MTPTPSTLNCYKKVQSAALCIQTRSMQSMSHLAIVSHHYYHIHSLYLMVAAFNAVQQRLHHVTFIFL